jgi:septal ring factor EnvC (AmiA/AmiB activator)
MRGPPVSRGACPSLPTGLLLAAALLSLVAGPVSAQDPDISREIQQSQRRLEQIREERARLEREIGDVRNRVRDVASELANVERRLSASRSVLAEVEFQSEATSEQIRETTRALINSQDRLAESQAVLNRRLRDIYKMGPLQTVQVLLGARSFTNLLNRYRYLQRIASFDRTLLNRVRALEADLADQNEELRDRMSLLGSLRQERLTEVVQLRSVETERQTALQQFRSREETASSRMEELEADEQRLTSVIDALEERRRELEAARRRGAGAAITAGDAGSLDWPIEGEIIYGFGRDQRPNGAVLRWNGIGIAAPSGSPVRAVKGGIVVLAAPFEGYGQMVTLSHGGGFYTLYLYLEEIGVVEGREVTPGQVVGTVGGGDTPEGSHLEFQIRAPLDGSDSPQAQDPLLWLRPRGGG